MAVPTWNQLTFLTPGQQTLAATLATKGNELSQFQQRKGDKPDFTGITTSQLKGAEALMRDLGTLIGPVRVAIQYEMENRRKDALEAFEAANP